ncbi:hypothetical protein CBS101457_006826 [Exobasidium rhododendri]|nr:hypothetical protein CBS101457_006826 [Exobasidium rhododendri]
MDYFSSSTAGGGGFGGNGADGIALQAVHTSGLTRVVHPPNLPERQDAVERLFTCGDDYLVRILPSQLDSAVEPLLIEDATKAVTSIDADADYLVTGSEDGCVRIYQHTQPISDLESQMTSPTDLVCLLARSSLAIQCVVLERAVSSGKTPRVAVCSDELVVKVVDAGDPKRVQLLTGHSKSLRAASWHPLRPQLVTCSCDGSIKVWDLSTTEPECVKTLEHILPVSNSHSEQSVQAVWHPSGDYFVIPSKTRELIAIDSQDYRRIGSFVVGQDSSIEAPMGEVNSYALSSNGRYLASATTDGKVTIWESETRKAIRSVFRQSIKTGISWHPTKDALAWTDTMGQISRWSDVVGPNYPSPSEYIEYLPASQARLKKQREEIEDLFGDTGLEEDEDVEVNEREAATSKERRAIPRPARGPAVIWNGNGNGSSSSSSTSRAQVTFQPTSTPMRSQRRYLCLNMIGSLMAIDQDTHQTISFDSHDANARRNWRFIDHFGYNMAAIGTTGALFACPAARRKGHPSSVYFKPFEAMGAWVTSGSEWSIHLSKGEEAVAVAVGGHKAKEGSDSSTSFVDNITAVVATSMGYLRFFSASGMQRYIWALGSQVVSMTAGSRSLLVVHRGNSNAAMEQYQNLNYTVIDLVSFSIKQEGTLPLARGSTLTWVGFNEMDYPAIFDSRQVLYVLDRCHGAIGQARWVPVLDSKMTDSASQVNFWPVGLEASNLMTIFLKGGNLSYPDPSASSRPLIQEVKLQMPLLGLETPSGALEGQYLSSVQMASFIRSYQASLMTEEEEEEAADVLSNVGVPSTLEHDSDKALLQLIQHSCKQDKHQRVLDAAKELHGTRTLDAALQIGAFFHLSSLVDRMGNLREWVATRRERDQQIAWSAISQESAPSHASARVLVNSSQSPSINGQAETRRKVAAAATAALSSEFPARPRKAYGEGRTSDLALVGQSPSSTWASSPAMAKEPSRSSDKENAEADVEGVRGQKRRAANREDDDDDDNSNSNSESAESGERKRSGNPFANNAKKISSSKNPFARTAGMTRDRSMHKSTSFFDRVDASMDSGNIPSNKEKSAPGNRVKQATLIGMMKSSINPANSTALPTPSPAFADESTQEEEDMEKESSLRLTLEAAARKDEETQRLQETQFDDETQESQFESLPMDLTV